MKNFFIDFAQCLRALREGLKDFLWQIQKRPQNNTRPRRGGAGGWTAGERPKRPVEGADGGGVSSTAPARSRASTPVFVRPVRFRAAERTDGTGWTAGERPKRPVEGPTMRPDGAGVSLSPKRTGGLEGRFRASCATLPSGVPRGTGWTAGGRDGKRAQGVAPRPSLSPVPVGGGYAMRLPKWISKTPSRSSRTMRRTSHVIFVWVYPRVNLIDFTRLQRPLSQSKCDQ